MKRIEKKEDTCRYIEVWMNDEEYKRWSSTMSIPLSKKEMSFIATCIINFKDADDLTDLELILTDSVMSKLYA